MLICLSRRELFCVLYCTYVQIIIIQINDNYKYVAIKWNILQELIKFTTAFYSSCIEPKMIFRKSYFVIGPKINFATGFLRFLSEYQLQNITWFPLVSFTFWNNLQLLVKQLFPVSGFRVKSKIEARTRVIVNVMVYRNNRDAHSLISLELVAKGSTEGGS